jgi:hypothetical protein
MSQSDTEKLTYEKFYLSMRKPLQKRRKIKEELTWQSMGEAMLVRE